MTTPVTTSEFFTLTGVFSCANACWVARMTKTAVNTANRETVLFISASPDVKAFPAHLYFPPWGDPLSVISDHVCVISDHRQKIRGSRPCQPLSFWGRVFVRVEREGLVIAAFLHPSPAAATPRARLPRRMTGVSRD